MPYRAYHDHTVVEPREYADPGTRAFEDIQFDPRAGESFPHRQPSAGRLADMLDVPDDYGDMLSDVRGALGLSDDGFYRLFLDH